MNNFIVLTKKEFVQMIRDLKVIWLPIVFIFLGITQPVITYYLPSILGALGSSQGIIIDPNMAVQKGGEVLASTLGSQFDQLGIIIIAVSIMGIIQTDKANGMLAFILTRPVTVLSYIGGKIVSNYLFVGFSLATGYFVSYLYVRYLISDVPFLEMIIALLFYFVWLLFMVSFITMISTIFNSQGGIVLVSIVFLLGCRIIVNLSPVMDYINPASMSKHAMEVLITESVHSSSMINLIVTLIGSMLAFLVTHYWIANKKFNQQ